MTELLPCPFCGNEVIGPHTSNMVSGWIECSACDIHMERFDYSKLISDWNTRPSPWQPISSAPKDGTNIDLWWGGARYPDCWWEDPLDCFFDKEGRIVNPSHWMYSPDGPKE